MTKLNLHKQFDAVPANENISWELEVETKSREDLILLASFIARAFRSKFFYDVENPAIIQVDGWGNSGKSMVVEAMMKTLLDQTDPLDMLAPDAPRTMFIEKTPSQAINYYCYAAGTHNGVSVLYSFDRKTSNSFDSDRSLKEELIAEFKQAAAEVKPAPAGGAIFGSRSRPKSGQWLTIDMTNNNSGIDGWGKTSTITVYNEKLKTDPKSGSTGRACRISPNPATWRSCRIRAPFSRLTKRTRFSI